MVSSRWFCRTIHSMAARPSDAELEAEHDPPVEREGRETLLPPVTRSALSTQIPVVAQLDPSGFQDVSETPRLPRDDRPRGARPGDVIGKRYVVEGQLGRGGMGRVLRV